eukprot:1725087-Heterocapsa_arctica.AAC.1
MVTTGAAAISIRLIAILRFIPCCLPALAFYLRWRNRGVDRRAFFCGLVLVQLSGTLGAMKVLFFRRTRVLRLADSDSRVR